MFSECVLLYLVQVSTHLAMLPSVYAVWRMGHGTMLGCGVATLVTSLLYHLCEVMNNQQCWRGTPNVRLLGLTDGNWHRLDNVFAILSLQLLCLYLSNLPLRASGKELLNWVTLFVTLAFQERGPWNIWNTVLPLVPYVVLVLVRVGFNSNSVEPRMFGFGILWLALAVGCFYKGLNEDLDYLRLWHGGWHVTIGAAGSCFALSKWNKDKRQE